MEAANRSKDQFLAMVSHELRNPLSPLLAWARMLRTGRLDEDKQRRAYEVIERSALAQAQLVEDLLDVSRIVSGKLRLEVRPTELAPVVQAALESLRPSADAKNIRLQVVLDPRAGTVAGDPDRLQQVVWNLVSNAIKFTPRGGRVWVALQRVESHVELVVADSGEGVSQDDLPHLFERFWQSERGIRRRHGGLGLGLAIVRHLVELHGGSVSAYSAGLGHGTEFRVEIPIAPLAATAPSDAHPHTSDEDASPYARLDELRILVVDDDPDSNEMLQTLFASCGAEVRVAASARQALEILDRWRPDVLVSDIGMPDVDGFELLAAIRQRPRERGGETPAIALTAFARTEDRIRVLEAGFQMHVPKPVDPSELTAVVQTVVRSTRLRPA
jgi:CheY-like chemotaxis protein